MFLRVQNTQLGKAMASKKLALCGLNQNLTIFLSLGLLYEADES